ncbi:MAG TPA: hypothetical protein VGD58_01950, partial [Herpetosiphonaceae bacterium]
NNISSFTHHVNWPTSKFQDVASRRAQALVESIKRRALQHSATSIAFLQQFSGRLILEQLPMAAT